MTFLPIVGRELRVASRRQYTYWSRVSATGFLLMIFSMILVFMHLAKTPGWNLGQTGFMVLKWISFIFAASAGIFMTSDTLSEEKREGTLGLLFLTDLRAHDVVLGKLMSQSLQSFYGLLAISPILALPLLVGGVTGAEFWRTMLVLCNTLFLSLAIGLLVSSMSREVIRAMNGALLLSLFFLLGLPWLDSALAHRHPGTFTSFFNVASPSHLLIEAPRFRSGDYWFGLGLQHALGWVFMAMACMIVPWTWQEKGGSHDTFRARFLAFWRFGGRRWRVAFRRKLLEHRPILWLALRDRWLRHVVLTAICLGSCVFAWNWYVHDGAAAVRAATEWHMVLLVIIVLWMAAQAGRFNLDAVRTGAMELTLVTPVPPEEIVRSQWSALWRSFLIPVILLLALQITGGVSSIHRLMTVRFTMVYFQIAMLCDNVINFVLMMCAMAWFGMWMGLTSRKVSSAALKTILFVCVLPYIFEIFVQGICMACIAYMRFAPAFWMSVVPPAVLATFKNIFFIVWSRHRLLNQFRETVARSGPSAPKRWKTVSPPIPASVPPPALVS